MVTAFAAVLLTPCVGFPEEAPVIAQAQLPTVVTFDWTVDDSGFYLEVKNGTTRPFKLDPFFVEGFNVEITGLDANFTPAYKTTGGVDIKRAGLTPIVLQPGNSHRTAFRIEHLRKTLPKNVKYIMLKWTLNEAGDKLPKEGLQTTLYELRKDPDKPDAGAGK